MINISSVPFIKYTHCGNSFIIVDEISQFYISEKEKLDFAHQASDVAFGIGADNLLVIQPFRTDVLKKINCAYNYWDNLPIVKNCDFIFRFFDKNESFTCGNGLLCIASYLHNRYGILNTHIMTEIPLSQPNVISIGSTQDVNHYSWCNLGHPRRCPEEVVTKEFVKYYSGYGDVISNLKITFRKNDLDPFIEETTLFLSGFLIYTGEPHLVFFPDECMPSQLANTIFISLKTNQNEKRKNFGSWLINHIGSHINKHYQDIFPAGINVNFARVINNTGIIEYRTYERGNNYETLACGTGATAVSYVAKKLRLVTSNIFTLIPIRCNWLQPNTELLVEKRTDGWYLLGKPNMIYMGHTMRNNSRQQHSLAINSVTDTSE